MQSKEVFGIACKYVEGRSRIFECVDSIRKYHTDADILVIDSFSDDDSYLSELKKMYNIIDVNFKNNNYLEGVIWYTYKNYIYDRYVFIHDGLVIHRNISEDINSEFTAFGYFPSLYKPHAQVHDVNYIGLEDCEYALKWLYDNISRVNIKPMYEFDSVLGSMFSASRHTMDILKDLGVDTILPSNKKETGQMERIWGIVMKTLGFDIKSNVIMGNYLDYSINKPWPPPRGTESMSNNGVTKYYGNTFRQ